jgi:g-D-glutamyl-meso-diaminopimelate peptidase
MYKLDLNLRHGVRGQEISNQDIVNTNINYTYDILEQDLKQLKLRYPFITIASAGKSVLGRELYYIRLGEGANEVFYNGAHHSLEWITTSLLMKFIENFAKAYVDKASIRGYTVRDIFNRSSIYIMPMVNPDGVDLAVNGLSEDNPFYKDLIKWNKGSTNFSKTWQANIRGVDLNHNYNASWDLSKKAGYKYGILGPGPTRYSGTAPESEPETKAIVNFTKNHKFRLVLAYHSQGKVIFWKYINLTPKESLSVGNLLSKASGYALSETTGITSYSGYKDWFIQEFRRIGFTIEVGQGKNPLPINQFNEIYRDNEEILLLASMI